MLLLYIGKNFKKQTGGNVMAIGKGLNCKYCPDYKKSCEGKASDCLCYFCPRNLGQCLCVKYCRETESVLNSFSEEPEDTGRQNYNDLFED